MIKPELQPRTNTPHVALLGAGASLACLPKGDKHGKRLPLMNNLIKTVGLSDIIKTCGFDSTRNFETIYSQMCADNRHKSACAEIEKRIYQYFTNIELPQTATVYDYLLLSLRGKDVIFTFNWDPLLIQAYERQPKYLRPYLPALYFLHGNVAVSYCRRHNLTGRPGLSCFYCLQPLTPTDLLYPVEQKNYHKAPFIQGEWKTVQEALSETPLLTVFGYSAPKSDIEALSLLEKPWKNNPSKEMNQFEIIDTKDREELRIRWNSFITRDHCTITSSLSNSSIGQNPRRTIEVFHGRFYKAEWIKASPLPQSDNLADLHEHIYPLIQDEVAINHKEAKRSTIIPLPNRKPQAGNHSSPQA